jgi:hypothetical protein
MIRKLFTVAGATAAAAALLISPQAQAQEVFTYTKSDVGAQHFDHCPANRSCIFAGLNGGHPYGSFASGDGDLADSSGPRGLNNTMESFSNRRGDLWCYYDGGGFNNLIFRVASGAQGNLLPEHRNRVSSLRICP